MPSQIKVDQITDSSGTTAPEFPNGMVSNVWKNSDGTENYKCRAWVNFDGTTTPPTIRASGNVSSVARNGVGDYTINFTTELQDSDYSVLGVPSYAPSGVAAAPVINIASLTISSARINTTRYTDGVVNSSTICVAILR